jgi:hypothetical protein
MTILLLEVFSPLVCLIISFIQAPDPRSSGKGWGQMWLETLIINPQNFCDLYTMEL